MGCGASNAATSVVSNSPPNNAPIARSTGSNRQHSVPPSQASLPLVKAKNYRHGAPITQGELNNQRTEFWSTRTEGNTIMWQSIRSAADAMLNNDLTLANAILEASNLSSPNGTLEVIYDERGFQYKVPQYCYANPLELTNEPVKAVIAEPAPSESGKNADNGSVSAGGPTMKVRVRINPGDHNLTIAAELNGTILNMKQLLVKEVEEKFPQITAVTVQRQRIIFMGKELQNTLKVKDAKFDDAKVVQVFLRPAQ